ncbi:hypothetical protein EJD97_003103 [Solanum chilense]|uniref:Histone acetyltransferase n=1 Tax=Solanum chilense TaxID=4083 RepID=A0A6N2C1R6_SOLCI|nr:hypothetical protein EJD97_003103 [Solanum chilense]
MPKSTRAYECVRKAWHSDRHQPIRGSFIQEIFRIVNEVHGSATKKNMEWQEKLPVVVFRAEEIMYSKANSEAEYMDLKTLWDRLNDAIDTIIRREYKDESNSGGLLQPCIEAALHLISTKRIRNTCPRYYPTPQANGNSHENPFSNIQFFSKLKNSTSQSNKMLPFSTLKLPMQTTPTSPSSCSIYPLYHGCPSEPSGPKFGSTSDDKSNENKKIALSCNLNASSETSRVDFEDVSENHTVIGCDLSLRLGSFLVPCTRIDKEDEKASDLCKLNDLSPQFNRGLSFFSKENADKNQFESSSMSSDSQNLNVKSVLAKRKNGEDEQINWPVKQHFNKFKS